MANPWISLVPVLALAAFFAWILLRRRGSATASAGTTSDAELRDHVDRRVAEGFDTEEDIAESTVDYFELPERNLGRIKGLVRDAMARQKKAQADWPAVTDCDRLDACFVELEKDGIVARQNFTCCQTCGHAEIGMEIEEAQKKGAVTGYTFYHQQDTESAADGGGIFLAYGSLAGGEPKSLEVANRIVDTLKRSGLTVTWEGTANKRIQIALDWKRRR